MAWGGFAWTLVVELRVGGVFSDVKCLICGICLRCVASLSTGREGRAQGKVQL
jgi:hypothetical protein